MLTGVLSAAEFHSATIQANILLHSRAAANYDESEPHFRPENRAKVRAMLQSLRARLRQEHLTGDMLDLGCGTGFMIGLAHDLFDEVHGVDVTTAMLDRVDTSPGNITLHHAAAEETPFDEGRFALVTAYSFLHHTDDFEAVLREAYRVLAPGGLMYIDLEPNRLFWEAAAPLGKLDPKSLTPMVAKARSAVVETYDRVEQELDLPARTLEKAEPTKDKIGKAELKEAARRAGFRECTVRHQWFLGQGEIMHGESPADAGVIEAYLRGASPLSDHLFKYLQAVLVK